MNALPELSPLHPTVRRLWQVGLALWLSPLALAAALYDAARLFRGAEGFPPAGLATAVLVGAALFFIFVWPGLRYRRWGYALLPDELVLERGVFSHVWTIVPLRRVQHLDVSQSLLEREFELGKLILHTSGSHGSEVVVPGLPIDEARRLRDVIKERILGEEPA